jgi:hypothetical protein
MLGIGGNQRSLRPGWRVAPDGDPSAIAFLPYAHKNLTDAEA